VAATTAATASAATAASATGGNFASEGLTFAAHCREGVLDEPLPPLRATRLAIFRVAFVSST
jgi:hypothetical protein